MFRGLEQLAGGVGLQAARSLQVCLTAPTHLCPFLSAEHNISDTFVALTPVSVRYVESFFVPLSSIEQNLRSNLVSINLSPSHIIKLQNVSTSRYEYRQAQVLSHLCPPVSSFSSCVIGLISSCDGSKTQCSSGKVTTLKCLGENASALVPNTNL